MRGALMRVAARRGWALALVVALCCCIGATPLRACAFQEAAARAPAAPNESEALAAYLAARAWLDADRLPSEQSPEAKVPLGGATGACVLLRLDGRLVGAGDASLGLGAAGDVDGELLVRRAVGRAGPKALADNTISATRRELSDKVTARLSLEIELAGPTRPLIGRTIADAAQRLDPGREGVALMRGDRGLRAYPSRLLAANVASRPDRTITSLMLDAGLPAKDLPQFGPEERVSLARFDTIRLRADSPKGMPAVVTRSGRTIEPFELTGDRARELAGTLAERLVGNVVAQDPADPTKGRALLGAFDPTTDTYAPPFATDRDASFGALSLSLAARAPSLPEALRTKAAAACRELVESTSPSVVVAKEGAADRVSDEASACLLAIAARDHPDAALRARLAARVADIAARTPIDPLVAPLVAAAILATDPSDGAKRCDSILRQSVLDAEGQPPKISPGLLIDAALPLALVAADPRIAPGLRADLVKLLVAFSDLIRPLQIRAHAPEFARLPPDVEGGLMLPGRSATLPDTQCLQIAAALAFAEPRLPDDGRAERLASVHAFTRFLAQHVAADPWIGGFRSKNALRGLVRGSLAANDCPPGPLSAGLILAVSADDCATRYPAPWASPAIRTRPTDALDEPARIPEPSRSEP